MKRCLSLFFLLFVFSASLSAEEGNQVKPKPKIIPVTTAQPIEGQVYEIAVIGAGAAGTMAAQRATMNMRQVLLFCGAKHELKNSRGMWVRKVENIPGLEKYTRTVVELRNETLTKITSGPFSDKLFVIKDSVTSIEKQAEIFCLKDASNRTYLVKYVILATGMMDVQPDIQGSIKTILPYANKQHINYCLLCDGHRSVDKHTVVIGHQEDAGKSALALWDRYHPKSIRILTNAQTCEFSDTLMQGLKARHIEIFCEPIADIVADQETKQLQGFSLKAEHKKIVTADIGFVFLGIRPNNTLAKLLKLTLDDRGLVICDKDGESSMKNVFVIGDLRANSLKQIYTAWQHAVDAVSTIDRRIRLGSVQQ